MPLDKWYPTRWGPVLPPWTKHQTRRALGWLLALLALTAGSLLYAWATAKPRSSPISPTPTPSAIELVSSAELFAMALSEAGGEDPNAVPCSFTLYPERSGQTLTYSAWVLFFSSSEPAWHLGVSVWQERGLLGDRMHIQQLRYTEEQSEWIRCEVAIDHPAIDAIAALRAMQEAGAPAMSEYFDLWPVSLRLVEGPNGSMAWEGEFRSRSPGDRLRIALLVDGSSGQLIASQGRGWP